MPLYALSKNELLKEFTLTDEELVLIYGAQSDKLRQISDSMSDLLATTLAANGVTAKEIYRLHLGVCNDDRTSMHILFIAVITGLISHDLFEDINNGQLAVVDFDDLIIRYRKRIDNAVEFCQIIIGN